KRRRRTVIVLVTAAFILVMQLPNLVNLLRPWHGRQQDELNAQQSKELADLDRARSSGEITALQHQQRSAETLRKYQDQRQEQDRQTWQQVEQTTRLVNLLLPPGWLPLGAMSAFAGDMLPPLLGTLGLTLLGTASLWRAYRTTVRLYTGQFTSGA